MSRRRRRRVAGGPSFARWVMVLAGGAVGTLLVIASGVANAVGAERPAVALRVAPFDARANAREADILLFKPNARQNERAAARAFATAALARDPTAVGAYRTLALTRADGSVGPSDERLLLVAETMSRRDVPTQLALIELHVDRGDVAGALRHYDTVLLTSPRYDPLLLPILVGAAADPNVRQPLAAMVVRSQIWRRRFYTAMANVPASPPVFANFVLAMRREGALQDADVLRDVAGTYAQAGQAGPAWAIFRALQPRWGTPPLLRNGRFDQPNTQPPFDWQLDDGESLSVQQNRVGGRPRLEVTSARGDSGRIARQLLALPPGRYQLASSSGPMADARSPTLYRQVTCIAAGSPGARIAVAEVETARPARSATMFAVPAVNCAQQWLEFGVQPGTSDVATGAWLGQVTLAPAR